VGAERLTQEEVALVLRRAAELDVDLPGAVDDRLPVEAIEAAAAEVGLPAVAVRQAVAEFRAGLLTEGASPVPAPATVVEAAVVPLEPAAALAVLGRWLSGQTFHCHRGRDGVEVWRVREDWVAGAMRTFDWSASVRLKEVREVVVRAIAVEGGTLVRLEATLGGATAAAPGIGLAVAALPGSTISVVAAGSGAPAVAAVGAALAGLGATGGWLAGRAVRRNRSEHVADELAAELDRVISGRALEKGPLDRLRALSRRHRGDQYS
jgi:hypothetical protein